MVKYTSIKLYIFPIGKIYTAQKKPANPTGQLSTPKQENWGRKQFRGGEDFAKQSPLTQLSSLRAKALAISRS
ncbi:hypothetical protein [Lactovum odontotermitis]